MRERERSIVIFLFFVAWFVASQLVPISAAMFARQCSGVPKQATWIHHRSMILIVAVPLTMLVFFFIVVFGNSNGTATAPAAAAIIVKTSRQHQMAGTRVKEWMKRKWLWLSPPSISSAVDHNKHRRRLIGSAPPTCWFRCSGCVPCSAVHISVQPGRSRPLEYYPEAWRCKCGNRLFMP